MPRAIRRRGFLSNLLGSRSIRIGELDFKAGRLRADSPSATRRTSQSLRPLSTMSDCARWREPPDVRRGSIGRESLQAVPFHDFQNLGDIIESSGQRPPVIDTTGPKRLARRRRLFFSGEAPAQDFVDGFLQAQSAALAQPVHGQRDIRVKCQSRSHASKHRYLMS